MIPTGMVLIGSSIFSGLLAIGLLAAVHHFTKRNVFLSDYTMFNDMSYHGLSRLLDEVKHIRTVHTGSKPLLNYHKKSRLSHVELHHKEGFVIKIEPRTEHERESLQNKLNVLESKLSYHKMPNIIRSF